MFIQDDLKSIIYGVFSVDAVFNNKSIKVLFENEDNKIDFFDGTVTDGGPVAYCVPDDVAGVKRGSQITINGTLFHVLDVQEKYLGPTKLILTRDIL